MNFRPLQEIEAIMVGGRIFDTGPFFARLRYIYIYVTCVFRICILPYLCVMQYFHMLYMSKDIAKVA